MRWQLRTTPMHEGTDDFQQLMSADWTPSKFKIDFDVFGDGCGCCESGNVLRSRINASQVFFVIGPVPERLNAARRGTGSDCHHDPRVSANFLDAKCVVRRCDRPFHESNVVGSRQHATAGFRKVSDLHSTRDSKQFVFAVQQRKLASITGCKLEDREAWASGGNPRRRAAGNVCRGGVAGHRSSTFRIDATRSNRNTGPSLQMNCGPN